MAGRALGQHHLEQQHLAAGAMAPRIFRRISRARSSSQSWMIVLSRYASPSAGTDSNDPPSTSHRCATPATVSGPSVSEASATTDGRSNSTPRAAGAALQHRRQQRAMSATNVDDPAKVTEIVCGNGIFRSRRWTFRSSRR